MRTLRLRESAGRLLVDPTTIRHLEVVEASTGGRAGSLLDEIDRTVTAMGGRLLRAWLLAPLVTLEPIRERLDAVEELAFRAADRGKLRETLKTVLDLERLDVARRARRRPVPRDLVALRTSLAAVPRVRLLLGECQAPLVTSLVAAARRPAPTSATPSSTRSSTNRRPWRATATPSATASTPSSTSSANQPIGQAGDRRARGHRAGAHRHPVAEGAFQPRLRLLHRDLEGQPARGARRLPPQADHRRRRALRHAGAQGLRGEGARRRRACRRARARAVRDAARPRRRTKPPRVLDTAAAARGARRPGRPGRDRGRWQLHQAPRARRRRTDGDRRAPPGGGAAGRRHLRAQ